MVDLQQIKFPLSLFPITIKAYKDDETSELVWTDTISSPRLVHIPPLSKIYDCKIKIKVFYADGTMTESFSR